VSVYVAVARSAVGLSGKKKGRETSRALTHKKTNQYEYESFITNALRTSTQK
jgi:hypothetical protein